MIQVEKLSFDVPSKNLYNEISFSLAQGDHCALIGSNGSGKSTLVDMLLHPENYLFDGRIICSADARIGYASQFCVREKSQDVTVFQYLSQRFLDVEQEMDQVCEEMAAETTTAEEMERLMERYQQLLDQKEAMDGDHYESHIRKQLHAAGLAELENRSLQQISGGEYKLLQIVGEMLLAPNLLVLDEPDVFLDFANLNGLCQLINRYKGTMLVVTHNRYLLNHCFNRILHLEKGELQDFDGTYRAYRCRLLREKLNLQLQHVAEQEEIARTEELVETLRKRATHMVNPVIGRSVNAKQSQLDRLLSRQIKAPFIQVREPDIQLPTVTIHEPEPVSTEQEMTAQEVTAQDARALASTEGESDREAPILLEVRDYGVTFDDTLLQDVSFTLRQGEKVALVGGNGTGKTTLLRDILQNRHPSIALAEGVNCACLSQLQQKTEDQEQSVAQVLAENGFTSKAAMAAALTRYCLEPDLLEQKISRLSGGEQNLLQLLLLSRTSGELLLLDEPTSHLDLYGQMALERAIAQYDGTVLMVSHDFYLVANCADYVLLVEDNTVRRIRSRNFRKMVYTRYFDQKYLEADRKRQELENRITTALRQEDLVAADKLCTELEAMEAMV